MKSADSLDKSTNTQIYKSFKECYLMTMSVALGTFSFAYNSYLFNGPLEAYKAWIDIEDSFLEGALVASFNAGGLIGCLLGFWIVKGSSRRKMLFLIDVLLISGTAGLMIPTFSIALLSRTVAGMGAGLTSLVTPMFLKEIIPVPVYGALGAQNLVLLSLGTIAQSFLVLGFPTFDKDNINMTYWPYYLLPPIMICIIRSVLLLTYFKHESPYYCASTFRVPEVLEFMKQIYKAEYVDEQVQQVIEAVHKRQSTKIIQWNRFIVGIITNIFYALSGITPIITYSTIIFKQVTTETVARILTIGMSIIKFIFYSTGAQVTQKFGRRQPLIIGTGLLATILCTTGIASYINDHQQYNDTALKSFSVIYVLVAIYMYFGVFFNTFGAIIPIYTPEILTGTYLSVALCCQWTFNITVTFLFPVIRDKLGMSYSFWGFGAMMLMATIYFYINIRETQNKSELQINQLWDKSKSVQVQESEHLIQ